MSAKVPVLLNALHTITGGGVTYLQGILPELAKDDRLAWTVLAPTSTLKAIKLPQNVQAWPAPKVGFLKGHLWEQGVLPFMTRQKGFAAVLCNANFVPLLAKRPMPILHTTTQAGTQAQSVGMRGYWGVLSLLTIISLLRAPRFFALTEALCAEYLPFPFRWKRRRGAVAPPAVTVRLSQKPKHLDNLIVAVGDYYAQKNYPLLLRAFALLKDKQPDVQLVIIGRAVDAAVAREMKQLIANLKLVDDVSLLGGLPHDETLTWLAKAQVFVSCSGAESFNIPLVEAMALETPVVCAKAPYVAEVGGEAVVSVGIDSGDVVAAMAIALLGVISNPSIAAMLARRGAEQARRFSWESTGTVLRQGIAEAVGVGASMGGPVGALR